MSDRLWDIHNLVKLFEAYRTEQDAAAKESKRLKIEQSYSHIGDALGGKGREVLKIFYGAIQYLLLLTGITHIGGIVLLFTIAIELLRSFTMPAPALELDTPVSVPAEEDAALAMFERTTQRYLKMSVAEFHEKWNSGYFQKHPELAHKAADVALFLPILSAR